MFARTDNSLSMQLSVQNNYIKYVITFGIIALFAFFQYVLWEYVKPAPYVLFYPAIIISCIYGHGTLSIILSGLLAQLLFVEPYGYFKIHVPRDLVRLFLFFVTGLLVRNAIKNEQLERINAEHAKEEILERERLLKREQEARARFVSMLNHDLQNPLSSIKMTSQMILKRADEKDYVLKQISRQASSIKRMEEMIHDLLDANKIEAGSPINIIPEKCELREIVETTVSDLESLYGHRFQVENSPDVAGNWCPRAVRRILENLCSNAIKYGDEKEMITLSWKVVNEMVQFSVKNKGKPIPIQEQEHLFEAYKRSVTATDKKGWGLGLTLVKGLVDAHEGEVKVYSDEKSGTTFTFTLPISSSPLSNRPDSQSLGNAHT